MLKCGEHHIVHQPTAQCVESIRDKGRGCRMLYLTAYRQHVSCVAVQRDAILATLAMLRTFAAYLRVAARQEWRRLDRPDKHILSFSQRNLTVRVTGRSTRPDHCRLDPIIIGMLFCGRRWEIFDSGQLLRA